MASMELGISALTALGDRRRHSGHVIAAAAAKRINPSLKRATMIRAMHLVLQHIFAAAADETGVLILGGDENEERRQLRLDRPAWRPGALRFRLQRACFRWVRFPPSRRQSGMRSGAKPR